MKEEIQRKANRKTLKNTLEILSKMIQKKNTLHTKGYELRTVDALMVEKIILEVYKKWATWFIKERKILSASHQQCFVMGENSNIPTTPNNVCDGRKQ